VLATLTGARLTAASFAAMAIIVLAGWIGRR